MQSIKNFIEFLTANWTVIVFLIAFVLFAIGKIKEFLALSQAEKKEAMLKVINEEILKLISDSEINWSEFEKAGIIKRAEVINEIYLQFPALSKYTDQEEIIKKIDEMINNAKKSMDKIFENTIMNS